MGVASATGMQQPGILIVGNKTFIKVDSFPLEVQCANFAELIGYLLASYYVFHLSYPLPLTSVFGFLEQLARLSSVIPESGKSGKKRHTKSLTSVNTFCAKVLID